jgi:hypothetical protein
MQVPSSAEFDLKKHLGRIDFLTEYFALQDARFFFNHKNDTLYNAYLTTASTEFTALLISYDTILHAGLFFSNYLEMGRQNTAILFDPREAHYAISPFFEFRHRGIYYETGLDHRCFHQIDRHQWWKTDGQREISPYWNEIYLKVSSANYRFLQMKKNYLENDRYGYLDRLKWQVWAGYFIQDLGDMDRTLLNGGHPWNNRAGLDAGYYFYKTKSWIFSAHHNLTMLIDTTGTWYWTGVLGLDADVYNRKHSIGLFIQYNYEFPNDQPLFTKDRLFEWGARFRF